MGAAYVVQSTPVFERDAKTIQAALREDPFNLSGKHNIRKLIGVKDGEGPWRIRSGVYRLRYDVYGHKVVLHSINHRSRAY